MILYGGFRSGGSPTPWSLAFDGTVDIPEDLPGQVRVFAFVPNPTSGNTRLDFELPASGMVRMDLYNPAGRLVRGLVNRSYPAGRHSIDSQCPLLPAGSLTGVIPQISTPSRR